MKNHANYFKIFSFASLWFWLTAFALIPTLMVLCTSFLQTSYEHLVSFQLTTSHYFELVNPIYGKVLARSFETALITTGACLVIAYPFSYFLTMTTTRWKHLLLLLVIIPFWTSSLIRTYAIMTILKARGLLNSLLLTLHIIHEPMQLLYSNVAVYIGLIYALLPFMILPLYANLEKIDSDLLEAARDLGANSHTRFLRIILPLSIPGIITGCILVFLPSMTLFFIPAILGGAKSLLLGNLIQEQFLSAGNWPLGSASSMVLVLLMIIMIGIYYILSKNRGDQDLL